MRSGMELRWHTLEAFKGFDLKISRMDVHKEISLNLDLKNKKQMLKN